MSKQHKHALLCWQLGEELVAGCLVGWMVGWLAVCWAG